MLKEHVIMPLLTYYAFTRDLPLLIRWWHCLSRLLVWWLCYHCWLPSSEYEYTCSSL